jgi:four helix bundle protein
MLPYERLKVWHEAHALAIECFRTSAVWQDFWLRRQLRRASASVAANLVEGSSNLSNAEFARFIGIALGSAKEAGYHLRLARDVGVLGAAEANQLTSRFDALAAMLHRLRASVRRGAAARS